MWATILTALQTNGIQLITLFGSISPYLGGAVAVILAGLLIYVGFKAAAQAWADQKSNSGGSIGGEVGGDQNVAGNVTDNGNTFLGGTGVAGATGVQATILTKSNGKKA